MQRNRRNIPNPEGKFRDGRNVVSNPFRTNHVLRQVGRTPASSLFPVELHSGNAFFFSGRDTGALRPRPYRLRRNNPLQCRQQHPRSGSPSRTGTEALLKNSAARRKHRRRRSRQTRRAATRRTVRMTYRSTKLPGAIAAAAGLKFKIFPAEQCAIKLIPLRRYRNVRRGEKLLRSRSRRRLQNMMIIRKRKISAGQNRARYDEKQQQKCRKKFFHAQIHTDDHSHPSTRRGSSDFYARIK